MLSSPNRSYSSAGRGPDQWGALRDEAILSLENISGSLFNRNRKNADRDEAVQRTFRPAQDAGKLGDHEQVVRRGAIVRL